jgi:hypothetical protein
MRRDQQIPSWFSVRRNTQENLLPYFGPDWITLWIYGIGTLRRY